MGDLANLTTTRPLSAARRLARKSDTLPVIAVCAFLLFGSVFAKSAQACSLALVSAIDVSASVDEREYRLQMHGLADALSGEEVRRAIKQVGGIWYSSFEWSGRNQHAFHINWTWLGSEADIDSVADRLRRVVRGHTEFPTAIGYALGFAAIHLSRLPAECERKVIDVAGDGVNNEGFAPRHAYAAFDLDGVVVNGLVIKGASPDPEPYYRDHVIKGSGAFVEIANGFDDYTRAMTRKLLKEIGSGFVASRTVPDGRDWN